MPPSPDRPVTATWTKPASREQALRQSLKTCGRKILKQGKQLIAITRHGNDIIFRWGRINGRLLFLAPLALTGEDLDHFWNRSRADVGVRCVA